MLFRLFRDEPAINALHVFLREQCDPNRQRNTQILRFAREDNAGMCHSERCEESVRTAGGIRYTDPLIPVKGYLRGEDAIGYLKCMISGQNGL